MANAASQKRSDVILAHWRGMSKGQKKYVFLASPLTSGLMGLIFVLTACLVWTLGQMAFNHFFGNPDDGFVSNFYYVVKGALEYWWLALLPPVCSLLTLSGVEVWSRKSTQQ
jgi:hypothetical protein